MPYLISVRPLLESLSSSRDVTGRIDVADVELGEQPFHFSSPVEFQVTLTNTGAGIVASGEAVATVRTSCVRCLCEFEAPIYSEVEGFYVLPAHEEGIPEEQEYERISEDLKIDLEPAVTQSVVIDLPFAPLHSQDCKGVCATCGADLNVEECSCEPEAPASPFAALADMLEKPENVDE